MRFFVPMTLLMTLIFVFEVAFGAMLSNDIVLPWGLGELGYVGAAALYATPGVILLGLLSILALRPDGKSRDGWVLLTAPVLYPVLCVGAGADLTRLPSTSSEVGLLIVPLVVLVPLAASMYLVYVMARAEIRQRAGLPMENTRVAT